MKEELYDKLEEFKDNLKQNINDRISNPFFFIFIFLLLTYNWDIFLNLFFYEGGTQEKISVITNQINDTYIWHFINTRVFCPLLYGIISYLFFKAIYFLYGKFFVKYEIGIIESHYKKINTKVQGERIVFESNLGIKEIEDLNKKIESLVEEKKSLEESLKTERESRVKLNSTITDLNKEYLKLQNELSIINTELNNKDVQIRNRDVQIRNKNLELENIKNNSNDRNSERKLTVNLQNRILHRIFSGLKVKTKKTNGGFNFINYIMSELDELTFFSEDQIIEIITNGIKNLYFESNDDDFKKLFFANFEYKDTAYDTIKRNSINLINYLVDVDIISPSSEFPNLYQLSRKVQPI